MQYYEQIYSRTKCLKLYNKIDQFDILLPFKKVFKFVQYIWIKVNNCKDRKINTHSK